LNLGLQLLCTVRRRSQWGIGVFSGVTGGSRPGDFGTKEKIPMPHCSSLVATKSLLESQKGDEKVVTRRELM
jgi:hypothetical protein